VDEIDYRSISRVTSGSTSYRAGLLPIVAHGTRRTHRRVLEDGDRTPVSFSFSALVVGSVLYSLPFVVQPLHNAFRQIPQSLLETAATLGAAPFDRFVSVVVPFCKKSFITASCLGFAHTVGEFGVVLMIGGNIPGETQVLSIALFDAVERLDFAGAHLMAGGLMAFSLLSLIMIYRYNSKTNVGL